MKKLFWRPSKVPKSVLLVFGIFSIAAMISVELIKLEKRSPTYNLKMKAVHTMDEALEAIRIHRQRLGIPIDIRVDPTGSGILGLAESPLDTNKGNLNSKQTTANPNWAAVAVEMLHKADVKKGDTIAIGMSGSFPALNIAVLSAAKAMELKVILTSSVGTSTYGANIPELAWLDMERLLFDKQILPYRSVVSTLGGIGDRAQGMEEESQEMMRLIIFRNKIRYLDVEGIKDSIDKHMKVYRKAAKDDPIEAYVNIGGSIASVGSVRAKNRWNPGVNLTPQKDVTKTDSVMSRFSRQGIPVIHFVNVLELAEKYGLPAAPITAPILGEGLLFQKKGYNLYLTAFNLIILLLLLYIFLKSDVGYRVFGAAKITQTPKAPEPMV